MLNRRRITAALIGLIVLVLGGWLLKDVVAHGGTSGPASAPAASTAASTAAVPGSESGLQVKALSSLPPEATDTWRLVKAGGPFPYPRNDNTVFGNREKLLPAKQSGYYREFTVKTPGSQDRGARRLITGQSAELYYTADHYASFVVVDPNR